MAAFIVDKYVKFNAVKYGDWIATKTKISSSKYSINAITEAY